MTRRIFGRARGDAPGALSPLPLGGADAAICLVLAACVFAYLRQWPHDLYGFDEGLFLYEAKRVADGEVMYRDFFEILTPASFYWMAAMYRLFGVSMETARTSMAVLHVLVTVLVYLCCRLVTRFRSISAAAAVAHVGIGYPALSMASAHWCTTFLSMALTLLLLCWDVIDSRRAFVVGLLAALIVLTQHQKGVYMVIGGGGILMIEPAFARRSGAPPRIGSWRRLACYAAGVLMLVVPVMAAFVSLAGWDLVFDALIRTPLVNYRRINQQVPWGFYLPGFSVMPHLIRFLPLLSLVGAARLVRCWQTRADPEAYRPLLILTVLSAFAVLSVYYYPDHTHLVMAAPIWFVLAAEAIDALLRWFAWPGWLAAGAAGTLALAFLVALGVAMYGNLTLRRAGYPVSYETAFGRVDFVSQDEPRLLEALEPLLRESGTREIFAFPCFASLYLHTQTSNPTRFQILIPSYSDPKHVREAMTMLELRQVPYVVRNLYWHTNELEPLVSYLNEHYEPIVRIGPEGRRVPVFVILRRKDLAKG